MGNTTLKGAFVPNNGCIWCGKYIFLGWNSNTDILQLQNVVDNDEVLLYKAADSQIIQNGLIQAILILIPGSNRYDWQVIYKGVSVVGNLVLKNESHVSLIDLYCIGVSCRDSYEMHRTHRAVKGGEIVWAQIKWMLVESVMEV